MNRFNLHNEFSGYYKIEAVKADGSRRVLADWFPNLILDAGLNRMGSSADYLNWCQVGSGSTEPSASQTSLVSRIAGTTTKESDVPANSGSAPFFARRTVTYRFAEGVAAGVLAEVGVGWDATGSLFSRARILDALGNPTTITVLADESLDVTYELRMYVWEGSTAGMVTLKGVEHTLLHRSAQASSWRLDGNYLNAGSLQNALAFTGTPSATLEGSPSGTNLAASSTYSAAYTPGSLYRDFNITSSLDAWNSPSGIGSILLTLGWGRWQIGFSPNIMKTSSDILTLQVRHSWGRKA